MTRYIIAANDFLRRGIITENLKDEVTKFSKWCDNKEKEGNSIKYPERILQKWNITAKPTIAPTEGAMIVDFIETLQCKDMNIIYNICLIRVENGAMQVYLDSFDNEIVAKIESYFDNKDIAERMKKFLCKNGAELLEYRAPDRQGIADINKIRLDLFGKILIEEAHGAVSQDEYHRMIKGIPDDILDSYYCEYINYKEQREKELISKLKTLYRNLNPDVQNADSYNKLQTDVYKQVSNDADDLFRKRIANYRKEVQNEQ